MSEGAGSSFIIPAPGEWEKLLGLPKCHCSAKAPSVPAGFSASRTGVHSVPSVDPQIHVSLASLVRISSLTFTQPFRLFKDPTNIGCCRGGSTAEGIVSLFSWKTLEGTDVRKQSAKSPESPRSPDRVRLIASVLMENMSLCSRQTVNSPNSLLSHRARVASRCLYTQRRTAPVSRPVTALQ